jgi:NitT/TauT family transport system permease protein
MSADRAMLVEAGAAPLPGPEWRLSARLTDAAWPLLAFAAVLGLWQFATVSGRINQLVLPQPIAVVAAFREFGSEIATNAWFTVVEALSGFALGNLTGLLLAVLFVHSETSRRSVLPLAMAAEAVPLIAITPALILWLGNGIAPKIAVTAFLVFFPMLVNAMRGLRSADAEVDELLHTLSATGWQRLRIVRLPAAVPFIFAALRISACACFVAAFVAEWVAADRGLGYLIVLAGTMYRVAEIWAAIIVGSSISLSVLGLVILAERLTAPWLARPGPL